MAFWPEKSNNELLKDLRNAEGESNEHKNQNKSPRTSAVKNEPTITTKTCRWFFFVLPRLSVCWPDFYADTQIVSRYSGNW